MPLTVYGQKPLSIENVNDGERLAKVDPLLYWAQRSTYPFLTYLLNQGIRILHDWEFTHYTKDLVPLYSQVNYGAGYNASVQVIVMDDASVYRPNDEVVNFNTGETLRVITQNSATELVVARNVGGTSFTITDNDYLIRISSGFRHGEQPGRFATTQAVPVTSYVQYMEKIVQTNKQNKGVALVGGDRRKGEQSEKQYEWLREFERAIILNEQPGVYTTGLGYTGLSGSDLGAAASTENPLFLSQSIKNFASDHAVTYYSTGARQTITETDFNDFLDAHIHAEAKGVRLPLFISAAVKRCITYWGRGKLEYEPSDVVHGIDCVEYTGGSGAVELIDLPVLSDVVSGVGWNGCGFSFIPGQIMLAGIPDQELKLRLDVVQDGSEQWIDKWNGAFGFIGINQKYVTWVDGISGPDMT